MLRQTVGKLNRKTRLFLGIMASCLVVYFGLYLYFRMNHTFIHRAGNYALNVRHGVWVDSRHRIEPGRIADGSQVFGLAFLPAAGSLESGELTWKEFEDSLDKVRKELQQKKSRRERMFYFFKPTAYLEVLFWSVYEPEPLKHVTRSGTFLDFDYIVLVRTVVNGRFGFAVDLPDGWIAEDRSENGDGFYLLSGHEEADVRVYGAFVMPENDLYNAMSQDPACHPEPFLFHDNFTGVQLTDGDSHYFIRTEHDVHLVFYVSADNEWLQRNMPMLQMIAASLRLERER